MIPGKERFTGRSALVTGASRGIGAAVALLLAKQGADVAVNYRSKGSRAEEIASQIRALGRRAVTVQADLTDNDSVTDMMRAIHEAFGALDILVLNASGGLEKDKPASYAMELNLTAQVQTLDAALPLMPRGASVVFVTSHMAHFYGRKPVHGAYEIIAASKKAGEDALRARLPAIEELGLRLAIVSGDMIEGTITPKLLERTQRGLIASRRSQAGALPTVQEFASAIVAAAADAGLPNGHVSFVGPID
ncbi:MAG TPA: SDR family oxidoreductase [Steroidobacteraceae bacterium]|jgi:NAD(P)-dependent dehydrogenase (short-subunit alcohol dehydrogenase family)